MTEARAFSVRVGAGVFQLSATVCRAGDDLTVTISGGQAPHVGCVVIACPHRSQDDPERTSVTSSVVTIPPHREELLARPLAERLAKSLAATVVVAAGIHTDGLTREGVAAYLRLGRRLTQRLLSALER
jgi:hypothetical protein